MQNWNRFILHQVEAELGKSGDPVSKLFTMKQESTNRCTRCGREEKKESVVLLSNLLYPSDGNPFKNIACSRFSLFVADILCKYFPGKRCSFLDLLERSLCPEQVTPAWCDKCEKYQPTFQSRTPKTLPAVLCLNTSLDNAHVSFNN